jgi:hypothetical protein
MHNQNRSSSVIIRLQKGVLIMAVTNEFENIKRQIKDWLLVGHYTIQDVPEAGKVWAILVQSPGSIPLVVSMVSRNLDIISLSINVEMDAYMSAFEALQSFERKNLCSDLRINLVRIEDFGFDIPDNLKRIQLNTAIFAEELTKPTLFRALNKVENTFRLVEFLLAKKFALHED